MNLIPWRGKRTENGSGREMANTAASPLIALRSEVDRLFDQFFREPFGWSEDLATSSGAWAPDLDISENEKELTIRAEVPGVDPKNLDISITGNVLTLTGEKRDEREDRGENYYHTERVFGRFQRSVQLPGNIDANSVSAEHANGVLTVHLQKMPGATPKKIPVNSAT